ncbi:hypothetical protein Pfo_021721, partial [Paulownia fortunei]
AMPTMQFYALKYFSQNHFFLGPLTNATIHPPEKSFAYRHNLMANNHISMQIYTYSYACKFMHANLQIHAIPCMLRCTSSGQQNIFFSQNHAVQYKIYHNARI